MDINSRVKPRAGFERDILSHSSLIYEAPNSLESLLSHFPIHNAPHIFSEDRTALPTGHSSTILVQSNAVVKLAECSLALNC